MDDNVLLQVTHDGGQMRVEFNPKYNPANIGMAIRLASLHLDNQLIGQSQPKESPIIKPGNGELIKRIM